MFREDTVPGAPASQRELSGTLNGTPFTSLADGDPRIGARLEVFAAGQYTWLPFEHIASLSHDGAQTAPRLVVGAGRAQDRTLVQGTRPG